MRLNHRALWMACITLAALGPLPPAEGQEGPKPDAAAAKADKKDTRLTLEDIQKLRRKRMSPEEVADAVAEQGRAFEVTKEVAKKLRSLGFHPAQIDAVKEASDEPLVPGKGLTTSDEEREQVMKTMKQIALKSGADIEPAATQHVTVWGSKEARQAYLPDIKKLEKFFHTKCAEPLRCGLDRRSTHFVLLKDHAEYQAWCRVEFDLLGSESAGKDDPPGVKEQRRKAVLDGFSCPSRSFWAISLQPFPSIHRPVAGGLANMYFWQLARPPHSKVRPLQTGFINAVESALYGSPISTFGAVAYGAATRYSGPGNSGWSVLVRQRMATKQATPLGELLKMDTDAMSQPHYAEGWTLVGLLSKQPAKFGKLLLELRKGGSDLEAIEKVYGWDEEKLTEQWRRYVMGQGGKGAPKRP